MKYRRYYGPDTGSEGDMIETDAVRALVAFFGDRPIDGAIVLDVGANDGVFLSNSLYFEQHGWRTLCVEGNPWLRDKLQGNRPWVVIAAATDHISPVNFHIYNRRENWASDTGLIKSGDGDEVVVVEGRTLNDILESEDVGGVDFLLMDIEGGEPAALRGFDFARWQPRACVIEDNRNFDEIVAYMDKRGYIRIVDIANLDGVYVRKGAGNAGQ